MEKIKRKLMIMLVIFLVLLSLGSVAATDDVANATDTNDTDVNETLTTDQVQDTDNDTLSQAIDESVATDELESSGDSLLGETPNEAGNFTELNQLISTATAGSTITLYKDYIMYSGESGIEISKNIVIDGQGKYTIDANLHNLIFTVTGNIVLTLKNITLKNGNHYKGGAIFSVTSVTLICENVSFVNNSATSGSGGAIYAQSGIVSVSGSDVSFVNNSATMNGGAIYAESGISVNASSVSFVNNSASNRGGAIYVESDSVSVSGTNVSFVDNKATSRGGAIYSSGSVSVIGTGSVSFVNNNAAYDGGAIYSASKSGCVNVSGSDVSFVNNSASGSGGAIYSYAGSVSINAPSVSFVNNSASGDGGGAIGVFYATYSKTGQRKLVFGSVSINAPSVSFVNNSVSGDGGAIYAGKVSVNGTDVSFVNNSAYSSGGAIYASYSGSSFTLYNSTFINCTSTSGSGGAIYFYGSNLTVNGSIFDNCNSSKGAIYIANGTYTLNGNYWCMNCTDESQFINSKLVYTGSNYIAPDNWVLMTITGPETICSGNSNKFTVTLDKLCYNNGTVTNFTGSLPGYTANVNGTNVVITNGVGIYDYTPSSTGNFTLVATSINSGNELCTSTFTATGNSFYDLNKTI